MTAAAAYRPPAAAQRPFVARRVAPARHVAPARLRPLQATTAAEGKKVAPLPPPITITDAALAHLKKLRDESGSEQLLLRMGVKSGGCSGMSYVMDFEQPENVKQGDTVVEYEGGAFRLVCDSKSLLYLFGMSLDYSSALIGGGFKFHNPNSTSECGCGQSFGV